MRDIERERERESERVQSVDTVGRATLVIQPREGREGERERVALQLYSYLTNSIHDGIGGRGLPTAALPWSCSANGRASNTRCSSAWVTAY